MKKSITELLFENVMVTMQEISRNSVTIEYFKDEGNTLSVYDIYIMSEMLETNISKSISFSDLVSDVSLYSPNRKGSFRLGVGIISHNAVEKRIFEENDLDLSIDTYDDGNNTYILVYNRIIDTKNNAEGLITVYLNAAKVKDYLIDHAQFNDNLYIVDSAGETLFSMNLNDIGKPLEKLFFYKEYISESSHHDYDFMINGMSYTVLESMSDYNSRRYILVSSNNDYQQKTAVILNYIFVFVLITFILSLVVAFVLSMRLYIPISELLLSVKDNRYLYSDVIENSKENEILYIMSHLDLSARELENLKKQLDEKVKLLNRANSKVLQMQINPHFMYNALTAVNWKIIGLAGLENEASAMIYSLANMMRYALETEHSIVTISNETENVKAYLKFQKIRFKDKLETRCDIPESIGNYSIIKLSLQPLIENAFSHGLKKIQGVGTVSVSATEEDNRIIFRIEDNGVGIEDSKALLIKERLKSEYTMKENQIGIANVNQRIKLVYGEQYGVELVSYHPGNTVFTVTIPKIRQK